MMQWLRLLDDQTDPVKHCDLYRDKEAGSCAHVDGPLCDFPGCSMLRDYRESKLATDGVAPAQPLPASGGDVPMKGE